jgi:hypothetical protein
MTTAGALVLLPSLLYVGARRDAVRAARRRAAAG